MLLCSDLDIVWAEWGLNKSAHRWEINLNELLNFRGVGFECLNALCGLEVYFEMILLKNEGIMWLNSQDYDWNGRRLGIFLL